MKKKYINFSYQVKEKIKKNKIITINILRLWKNFIQNLIKFDWKKSIKYTHIWNKVKTLEVAAKIYSIWKAIIDSQSN